MFAQRTHQIVLLSELLNSPQVQCHYVSILVLNVLTYVSKILNIFLHFYFYIETGETIGSVSYT